jgi:hypothetical protein
MNCHLDRSVAQRRDLRFHLAAAMLCTIKQQEAVEWGLGFVKQRCGLFTYYSS